MEIKQLTSDRLGAWDQYVYEKADATFFHRAGWKTVIERSFGHNTYYMYAESDNRLRGILPLGHIRSRLFGNALISNPFCVYGGIVADNEEAKNLLEKAAIELSAKLKVDYLEMRNINPVNDDWIKKELYVTFSKTLDPDPDKNMAMIPRKQRAMVRKGIKAGLLSSIDTNVDRLYDAYSQSVHSLGTPVFSKRYFTILKEVFNDNCEILIITKDERLIAGVMNFYFRDQVLPYYGGGTPEARATKANDFMYWELMRRSSERGILMFDYGRSKKDTGSYSFKKNWGFEPKPLSYEYYLVNASNVPDVNPLNPKYQRFIRIWKRLPLSLTKMIGPHIVKNLG